MSRLNMFEQQKSQGAKNIVFGKKDTEDGSALSKKQTGDGKTGNEDKVGSPEDRRETLRPNHESQGGPPLAPNE